MTILLDPFLTLWRRRVILIQTTRSDIRVRFAGSVLGLLWLVLYPLLFLGAYALVYLMIFKVRYELFTTYEGVVLIFCGLVPFIGFSEGLSGGVSSVISNTNLVKNTLYPIELIPVKAVLTAQCTQVVGMIMLLIVLTIIGKLTFWALLLPIVWVMQVLFTIGLIWILSACATIFRDLQNIVAVAILLLMMLSPIAYTIDMAPANLRLLLALNPLYYIITCYQEILMQGQFPRHGTFWATLVMSLVTFWVGWWFIGRMKNIFADKV